MSFVVLLWVGDLWTPLTAALGTASRLKTESQRHHQDDQENRSTPVVATRAAGAAGAWNEIDRDSNWS
jgi:hypothetical protein